MNSEQVGGLSVHFLNMYANRTELVLVLDVGNEALTYVIPRVGEQRTLYNEYKINSMLLMRIRHDTGLLDEEVLTLDISTAIQQCKERTGIMFICRIEAIIENIKQLTI